MASDETTPGSRCFVVCGKAITGEELQDAFNPYGEVQCVKVVRDKGVAYVKYDKASAAALAIENLNGAVLNNGRGPKLKVLLAEAPSARGGMAQMKPSPEMELSSDPDNVPPRSRLFLVVPKLSDTKQIQDDISQFSDLEYCKTDLAATRGVVFAKFTKSSAALKALETIAERGNKVAGYTVKAMLADPKTKRVRQDGNPQDLMYGMNNRMDYSMGGMDPLKLQMNGGGQPHHAHHHHQHHSAAHAMAPAGASDHYSPAAMGGLGHMGGLGGPGHFNSLGSNMNNMGMHGMQPDGLGNQGLLMGMNHPHSAVSPVSPNNLAGVPLSKQRLFVVLHKGVTEDAVARLFRRFPGMEYCDLKKDRATGKSKGYCYVNYSTPDAAAGAVAQLNGIEFPPHSGHRIKVMFAEPMGTRNTSSNGSQASALTSAGNAMNNAAGNTSGSMHSGSLPSRSPGVMSMQASTASATHTPLSRSTGMGTVSNVGAITPDTVASVGDSLAGMSLHHIAAGLPDSQTGMQDGIDRAAAHLASPVAPGENAVARELMFNVN